ncbi:MAG TPA: MFS transporter [Euzebyales bacterium]|nr:MFS transporter [Euzebyales bacterium]
MPRDASDVGVRAAWINRWTFLSLTSLCYWTATQSLRPMVALRLADLGSGDALIGVVLGLHSAVTFFIAVPSGRLVDRAGLRRALIAGLAGMAVAGAAFAGSTAVWQLAIVLVAAGVAELAAWVAMQALASHAGTGQVLRRQLALFSFAWGTGLAVGPALGSALYARVGFSWVGVGYGVAAVIGGIGGALVPWSRSAGGDHDRDAVSMRSAVGQMWASAPVRAVLLSSFVVLFVYGVRNSFYPLLLERRGVPVGHIGLLLSTIGVASLIVRLPLPALLRRVGAEPVLIASMWSAIVAITVTPWLGGMWLYLPAAALVGIGVGVNPPVTVELMALHTRERDRGLAMGLRVGSNRLAQMVQPVLFGAIASVAGLPAAFLAGGAFLSAVAAAARPRRSRHAPPEPP